MNLKRLIDGAVLSMLFLIIFVYAISGVQWVFNNSVQGQTGKVFLGGISNAIESPVQQATQAVTSQIPEPEINAQSAISVETNLANVNNVIFEKSGDEKLPIASITKLMTAIVVLDNYNLSSVLTVSAAADSQAPMKHDVKMGDAMPAENFLYIMLVGSSNKSAYTLSELIGEQKFVSLMNKRAKDFSMNNTLFSDPTGLSSENISTPRDLVKLAAHILRDYPQVAQISRIKELYIPKFGNVVNTDELLGDIPNVIASKTGFTTEANGCLLLVIKNPKNNDYLINVVLGADDRFAEMQKLINWSDGIYK